MCECIMNLRKKTIHKDQPNKVTNYEIKEIKKVGNNLPN